MKKCSLIAMLSVALPVVVGCAALKNVMGKTPRTGDDYETAALDKCSPSCFRMAKPERGEARVGCGMNPAMIDYERMGHEWSTTGVFKLMTMGKPKPLKVCEFPAPDPDPEFARILKEAEKRGKAAGIVQTGDVIVTEDNPTWHVYRDSNDVVTSRAIFLTLYSRSTRFEPDTCGGEDATWVCAHDSNSVLAHDIAAYRVKEAKQLAGKDAAKCRVAAWHAATMVDGMKDKREGAKRNKSWLDGLTYMTTSGNLSEDELFEKLDQLGARAHALWRDCGGEGDPPGTSLGRVWLREKYYK